MKPLISVVIPTHNRCSDLLRCVESLLLSTWENLELIIVNNASTDGTMTALSVRLGNDPRILIIDSDRNLGAGGGRNLGASRAKGEYLLFVDNDNLVDAAMIELLYDSYQTVNPGMIGPLMLYGERVDRIWCYVADINLWTSRAHYRCSKGIWPQILPEVTESGHIPNCFMVSRSDYSLVGGFEEKYIVMYEEADFAEKIKRRTGKKVYINTNALTQHFVPYDDQNNDRLTLGIRDETRAFLLARNRILFMKRNASLLQRVMFYALMNPTIVIYYVFRLARQNRWDLARAYLKGAVTGLFIR